MVAVSAVKKSAGVDPGVTLLLRLGVIQVLVSQQAKSPSRLQHRCLVHPHRHIRSVEPLVVLDNAANMRRLTSRVLVCSIRIFLCGTM